MQGLIVANKLQMPTPGNSFHLSFMSKILSIHVQWITAHIVLLGNTLAGSEAKWDSTLPQSSVPIDLAMAKVLIWRMGHEEFHARYL